MMNGDDRDGWYQWLVAMYSIQKLLRFLAILAMHRNHGRASELYSQKNKVPRSRDPENAGATLSPKRNHDGMTRPGRLFNKAVKTKWRYCSTRLKDWIVDTDESTRTALFLLNTPLSTAACSKVPTMHISSISSLEESVQFS